MLQNLPSVFGRALERVRPGPEALACKSRDVAGAATLDLVVTSPAFAEGGPIPRRYTADGECLSPPLAWSDVPATARALVLLIEDADSPTPSPLVHCIALLAAGERRLDAGALPCSARDGGAHRMGRNSFFSAHYLPPDPPPGHGPHRYAFEIFALVRFPAFERSPGRSRLLAELRGHVMAKGCLIGTYARV